jgi:GNAT superfamily N-acetyltransferase
MSPGLHAYRSPSTFSPGPQRGHSCDVAYSLSVTENVHEGQGLAKHWLGLVVHWLFGLGHSAIRLDTTADTRADRFYRMQGWERKPVSETEVAYFLHRPDQTPDFMHSTRQL